MYNHNNSQKEIYTCLFVHLFFSSPLTVLACSTNVKKKKKKKKTSKFYRSKWHDMTWWDMMWHDTAWHDRAPWYLQDDLVLQHPAEGGVALQNVSQRSARGKLHHQQKSRLLSHSHQGDHARVLQAPHDGGLHDGEGRCKGTKATNCLGGSK